jgi:tripartite-type tricarboxylate transporter receptor subunit TctC
MRKLFAAIVGLAMLTSVPASAAETVTIWVGGGKGFERYAAAIAPYLGKHLPGNPTIITKSMKGGGGSKMLNYLTSQAPKDGTEIGMMNFAGTYAQAYGYKNVKFDLNKMSMLASVDAWDDQFWITHKNSGIDSVEKLKQGFKAGASGKTSGYYQFAVIVKNLLNVPNGKVIPGYNSGTAGIVKAMEQKEVDSFSATPLSALKRFTKLDNVNLLFYWGKQRYPSYPNVPTVYEVTDKKDHAVIDWLIGFIPTARVFLTPPGLSDQKVKELRTAFDALSKDPAFLANLKKVKLGLTYASGEELQKIAYYLTTGGGDPSIIARAQQLAK